MDQRQFESILNITGARFLQYILNVEQEFPHYAKVGDLKLNETQLSVLPEFFELLRNCGALATSQPFQDIRRCLVNQKKNGENLYNYYRKQCGGSLWKKGFSDPVVDYIARKFIDIYPDLLIRPVFPSPYDHGISAMDFGYDGHLELKKLLLADEALAGLVDEGGTVWSLGYLLDNGLFCHSQSFCFDIIIRSFYNCCYRIKYEIDDVMSEIQDQIELLRKIGRQEEIEWSSFAGLYGIRIANTGDYQISKNCVIRNIGTVNHPLHWVHRCIATSQIPNEIYGCVLEFKQKVKALKPPVGAYSSTFAYPDIPLAIRNLKFSIVFANESVAAPLREMFIDFNFPVYAWQPRAVESTQPLQFTVITTLNKKQVADWFNDLNTYDTSALQVPLKRMQVALFEREVPEDSLLDTFITWEGMFSGKFETTFQVTGAIAKFLEDDPMKRAPFLKRLKDLYNLRSNLAHGEGEENKLIKSGNETMDSLRKEVEMIGLRCLKKIIKDDKLRLLRPEERVKQVLIFS